MKLLLHLTIGLLLLAMLAGCSKKTDGAPKPSSASPLPSSSSGEGPPSSGGSREASAASVSEPSSSASVSTPADQGEPAEQPVTTLKLVVPEGYTLARIGMTLEEMGVCTAEEFIAAAQNGDFSAYPLLNLPKPDTNRCFVLEGYLFPATYEIYSNETPDAIIRRMLDHMESKISPELRAAVGESAYSFDEILTLASIIEKESFGHEVMPRISSVLHNRLDAGMQLQCDVTIAYVEGAIKPFITGDADRYSADYNTYKCAGIPAGAICNPSMDAIAAALNPEETDYLFFLTDKDNSYYFTADWDEHQQNYQTYVENAISTQ